MNALANALKGPFALLFACALVYIEEAGIPTPAPGEVVLVGIGLLVAAGTVPWWIALPAVFLADVAGATTGYAAARLLGLRRLRWAAKRIGVDVVLERASIRLRSANARDVAITRLIPGLRIMTTLVAGALGVEWRVFMRGMIPAAAIWVVGFVGIGFFVGVPAERVVGGVQALALRAGGIVAILVAGYLIARRIPAATRREAQSKPRPPTTRVRRVAAFAIDVLTIAGAVAVLDAVTGLELGNLNYPVATTAVLTALSVLYVVIARRSRGQTLGERLVHG